MEWVAKLSISFITPDRETALRILEEAEGLIAERLKTASEPKGRIIRCERSDWECADTPLEVRYGV